MSPKEVDALGDMQSSRVMLQSVNLSPQSHSGVEVLGDGDGSRSVLVRRDGSLSVLVGPLWGEPPPPDADMSSVDIFLRITLEYNWERERKNQTLGNLGTIIQRAYRIYNIYTYTHKHNPHTHPHPPKHTRIFIPVYL